MPEAHANASLSQAWLVHDDTGAGSASRRPRRHDFEFLRLNRRNADKTDLAGGFYESHRVKNPRAWPAARDRPTEASAAPASPLVTACYRLRPFLLRRSGRLRMGWPRAETLVGPFLRRMCLAPPSELFRKGDPRLREGRRGGGQQAAPAGSVDTRRSDRRVRARSVPPSLPSGLRVV